MADRTPAELLAEASGLTPASIQDIWQDVKANHARLNGCVGWLLLDADPTESTLEDLAGDNPPKCPSREVPYIEHLGLHGTCAALLAMTKERDELRAKVAELSERPDHTRLSGLRFLPTPEQIAGDPDDIPGYMAIERADAMRLLHALAKARGGWDEQPTVTSATVRNAGTVILRLIGERDDARAKLAAVDAAIERNARIRRAEWTDEDRLFVADFTSEAAQFLAEMLLARLDLENAPNYALCSTEDLGSLHVALTGLQIDVCFRRTGAPTPHELRLKAEKERDEALALAEEHGVLPPEPNGAS